MSPTPATAAPSASLAPSPAKRFSEVDSLRAIACALVIVSHVGNGRVHDIFVHLFECGWLGVLMFFAISGFVIPGSLRGARGQGAKRFAIRRFWRLFPPFWFTLLLTWWLDERYSSEQWLWDAVMLPSFGVRGEGFIHFWTLEVELIFYCLVATLFCIFGRLGWKVLLSGYFFMGLITVARVVTAETVLSYLMILPYLTVMFWGGLCREILHFDFTRWHWLSPRRGIDWARSIVLGLTSGGTTVVVLIACSAMRASGRAFELAGLLATLGFLFWVILKPVRLGWLSHMGRWTYSTYLLHQLVIVATYWMTNFLLFRELSRIPLFFTGFVLALSFAVGALAYRWIEQPSDAIGKRLAAAR